MIVPYEVVLEKVVVAGKSDDAHNSGAQAARMSSFEERNLPGAEARMQQMHPEADNVCYRHRRMADTVFDGHYLQE